MPIRKLAVIVLRRAKRRRHRLMQQVVPVEDIGDDDAPLDERSSKYIQRPSFSLPLMTNNFRRFNARWVLLFAISGSYYLMLLFYPRHTHSRDQNRSRLRLSNPRYSPPELDNAFPYAIAARHSDLHLSRPLVTTHPPSRFVSPVRPGPSLHDASSTTSIFHGLVLLSSRPSTGCRTYYPSSFRDV